MAGPRQHSGSTADDLDNGGKDVEAAHLEHAAGAVVALYCYMTPVQCQSAQRSRYDQG